MDSFVKLKSFGLFVTYHYFLKSLRRKRILKYFKTDFKIILTSAIDNIYAQTIFVVTLAQQFSSGKRLVLACNNQKTQF